MFQREVILKDIFQDEINLIYFSGKANLRNFFQNKYPRC